MPRPVGSSPHTRGAPILVILAGVVVRIIPAYAGSTPAPAGRPRRRRDHPRIRGEHPLINPKENVHDGSSPHTRGARSTMASTRGSLRIIPAYAGSTPASD